MRQSRLSSRSVIAVALVAGVAASLLGGCSNGRVNKYRMNPTPELDTMGETRAEMDNRMTVTNDTNARSFNRDVGYLFLQDRPSRLTPRPVGY